MAKSDQQEAFERLLLATFVRVVDFTKFAETKNAALLTFSSAWTLALCNLIFSGKDLSRYYVIAISISIPLFLISAILSLTSFLPKTNLSKLSGSHNRHNNLLFFGDIDGIKIPDFKAQFLARYHPENNDSFTQAYINDLMEQVSINSSITHKKFHRFNIAAKFTLAALVIMIVPPIVHLGIEIKQAANSYIS